MKFSLWHGSDTAGLKSLSPESAVGEYGIYLTPKRGYARRYGKYLYEVFASIKKPLVVDWKGSVSTTDLTKADIQKLQKQGYDSIVVTASSLENASEVVVFRSAQVHIMKEQVRENPGDIVAFPERPPRIDIAGRSYALADDDGGLIAGALGAIVTGLAAGEPEEEIPRIGPKPKGRIIMPEGGRRWRWLWAYDADAGEVGMWRVSDGSEKLYDRSDRYADTLVQLEQKGQLNRVRRAQMHEIEAFMRLREQETVKELQASLEERKTPEERDVDRLVQQYFDERVRSEAERRMGEAERGVVPMGFRPFAESPRSEAEQAKSYAWGEVIKERFALPDVEAFVGQSLDLEQLDIQAVYFARTDVVYREGDRYLR